MELTEQELEQIAEVLDEHVSRLVEAIYKEGAHDMLAETATLQELMMKVDGERQRLGHERRKAL